MRAEELAVLRRHMLAEISADIFQARDYVGKPSLDQRVMAVMAEVPRHEFVPLELQPLAYANVPLPIGFEKTTSQPFIVALMTDLLDLTDASYIDSSTIGLAVTLTQELAVKRSQLRIVAPAHSRVRRVFALSGVDHIADAIADDTRLLISRTGQR